MVTWDKDTEIKFAQLIEKIPVFLRGIAQEKILKKAETLATTDNRTEITKKDMIDAFFTETPFGFHGPMKNDMISVGIDYTKYGYDK
ncbi:MAG: DUF2621 family protein [Candidatus Omnitrophica bacterium]|nr:DUF2621 family protein [Candidatus Omnitrophota bacterium]